MVTSIRRLTDRRDAARQLTAKLDRFAGRHDAIVVGLPRGGVVTAAEIAAALDLPLDIIVVRKLGTPGQEELAMGAVARDVTVINEEVVRMVGVSRGTVETVAERERRELARREDDFRSGRPPLELAGKTVIIADDGLATGSTMRAAVIAVRRQKPAAVVLAVPVAPPAVCAHFKREVDQVVCLSTPEPFGAVAFWYDRFEPVTDREVTELLAGSIRRTAAVV